MEFVLHMFDLLAKISYYSFINGPLAQLDRARSYGLRGWGFEFSAVRQKTIMKENIETIT